MIIKKISPLQQRLIIEDLYNSTDSISSTERFNKEYGDGLGRHFGSVTMSLNDFAKVLLKTKFPRLEIDKAINRATGVNLDFDKLY